MRFCWIDLSIKKKRDPVDPDDHSGDNTPTTFTSYIRHEVDTQLAGLN